MPEVASFGVVKQAVPYRTGADSYLDRLIARATVPP